jgi:predicted NACHT family NTPase
MDRTVRRIESTSSRAQQDELRPISAYDDAANIVLLGDPGAGKTHTFRECAARCRGRYVTARAFLVTPAAKFNGILFIDGLDEKRAGRGDRDTVDALVEKLFAVGPSKVRISCRVADWLGDSDLAALRPYFEQSGDPVVLQLARLSSDEQRIVVQAEGLSASEADAFLAEATKRALGDFLENPQNLIMLLRAVRTGTWPATRKELFELSTQLMLKEFNSEHARSGSGVYTAEELRQVAGAICAARLVSDVEAISLTDHEDSPAIPSYRSLSMVAPEKAIAALGRRVFAAGPASESVDYAHRTTAEYLGATWLAEAVRNGMPLGRLQALMGIDGHPAPELRGLHAWLAVLLPEHANRLIDTDPYGILVYGDAASLPQSSCAHLVKALGRLSQTDPWFRSGNWHSPAIAALSRADMVEEFRAVLGSNNAGFGVRSIVVEAAALGAPMPALQDNLADIVVRSQSPYAERLYALIALLRIGPDGKAAAQTAFHKLGMDIKAVRLRAEMIHRMYGEPHGPADITALLKDLAASTSPEPVTGILHTLSEHMPLGDIPAVLDALPDPNLATRASRPNEWEVARFVDHVLIRAWRGIADIEPARTLQWLRLRNSYSSGYGSGRSDQLRAAILKRRDRLSAIADHFFDTLVPDQNRWLRLARFREVTLLTLTSAELLVHMRTHMARVPVGSEKELFLYEAAFSMVFSMDGPGADAAFEALFAMADSRDDLREVRDASVSCKIPSGHLSRLPHENTEQSPEELRARFEKEAEAIRNGSHLGWLTWATQVYFGLFYDSDQAARPRERLVTVLGEANAKIAIEGFIAALSRPDVPSLADVVSLSVQHQRRGWWHVLTAGLIEEWETNPSLGTLGDDFLKAIVAFDLTNPVFEEADGSSRVIIPNWKVALTQERPELVRDAYVTIARAKLAKGDQIVDGLRELMVEDAFKPYRGDTALQLLRDFPNADHFRLDEIFDAVFATPAAHGEFLTLAERVLTGAAPVGEQQHDMWLAAAYLLSPSRYEVQVDAIAKQRPSIVFNLRDRSGYEAYGDQQPSALTVPQLEFLARLTGTHYPETGYPSGGWGGNTNPWDAAEYCRNLINAISAVPSEAATGAIRRLEADAKMASYNAHLRHALANQEKRRRESEYDRPDWLSTIEALSNGAPATVADLHALLLDQLDDLRRRISRENTDIYKSFWNLDSYSRPKTPRPEDACRDTLVTLLRPTLAPKGITVEPEGHMVADKRADISAAMPGRKVLCEWKRDSHADLWTAADQQLERFYAHDPEAKGFGIYGVLWFGDKGPSPMPKHPNGLEPPKSAAELEQMLRDRIPADRRRRLAALVIDVFGPPAT